MTRIYDRKCSVASSGAALAAVMMAGPALAVPVLDQQAAQAPASASSARSVGLEKHVGQLRSIAHIKFQANFKNNGEYSVAGVGDGHVVFEDARGNLFYVDDATGDQKFVMRKIVIKFQGDQAGRSGTWFTQKRGARIAILGVDDDGRTIMSNAAGEKFFLDSSTGDMVFVK